jgi:alkylation response protein AidB-like acyl-CoA dehydrogenase
MTDSSNFCGGSGLAAQGWEQRLQSLYEKLSKLADSVESNRSWPSESLQLCSDHGVFRWFIPRKYNGWECSERQILCGYLGLSQACLTTTFIITQWHAACRRLLSSQNNPLKNRLLPLMAEGNLFATVGISHLTTSRQHLAAPVLSAKPMPDGFLLNGLAPWVTGGIAADWVVVGATLDNGDQLLAAVPSDRPGVKPFPGLDLIALAGSCTDRVEFNNVLVTEADILFGPAPNVMKASSGSGGAAGGLQTSVLAIGLATAASHYLKTQALKRPNLVPIADKMTQECHRLTKILEDLTDGEAKFTMDQLRQEANSLVLRSTQAALQTAKGAGFLTGHPAGRWAQQALFFLVWSCPQNVVDANLCELAGLNHQH